MKRKGAPLHRAPRKERTVVNRIIGEKAQSFKPKSTGDALRSTSSTVIRLLYELLEEARELDPVFAERIAVYAQLARAMAGGGA